MSEIKRVRLIVEPRDETRLAEVRRSMIGGTDIAPILGVSTKKTRFAVWLQKTGQAAHEESGEEALAGQYLEPFVLEQFGKRLGVHVSPSPFTYRLADAPFLGANPDGLVHDPATAKIMGGVDAKTRSPYVRHSWGDSGSSDVPADEFLQAIWYCEVMDLDVWWDAVLFDRALSIYVIPRDRELGALAVQEATAFWNDYVATGREPAFEGAAAADYLSRRFPRAGTDILEAGPEDEKFVAMHAALRAQRDAVEEKLSAVDNALKARIGAAAGLRGERFNVSWSNRSGTEKTDWRAVVNELRSFPMDPDEAVARRVREAIDTAISSHTASAVPARVFRVTVKGPLALPAPGALALPGEATP